MEISRRVFLGSAAGAVVAARAARGSGGGGRRDYAADAEQYARDVVAGKFLTCHWTKQACQRFLDDRRRESEGWQYVFDKEKANRFCRFFELMPHVKGRWPTRTIKAERWQCFIFCNLFGWVHKDTGLRRFRKGLVVIPVGNSKSTMGAVVGLYLLGPDDEPGAEVYSAATTRDQARIVWEVAHKMTGKTQGFRDRFGVVPQAHSITVESRGSFFKPLSREADTIEGVNAHGVIVDELHAHKNREVFDVLEDRTRSRRQPLTFIISTEGDNPTGVFAEQVEYAQQILDKRHEDEAYFGVIYTIDKGMDWTSRESWACANPNLGVSVMEGELADRCRRALKNPAAQSSFLTKRMNVRVGAGEAYCNMFAWQNKCCRPDLKLEDFQGEECVIGLDLASKIDLAAKVYLFRRGKDHVVFGRYYIPEDRLDKTNPNYDFYRGWAEQGWLTTTPGNVIDFELIESDLIEDDERFRVREIAYDPFQATELSTRMRAEGLEMSEVPQTVKHLSEPMKDVQALIDQGRILHNGDPALSWQIGNLMAREDVKENVYPRKARPTSKIDAAVAMIMARSRMLVLMPQSESALERGMRFI